MSSWLLQTEKRRVKRLARWPVRRRFRGPVDDSDEAQFDGNDPARQRVRGVRAGVHQVQLGDHGQRPPACRVDI